MIGKPHIIEGEVARIAETAQAAMHSGRDNYGSVERIQHDEDDWLLTSRIPILSSSGSRLACSAFADITEIKIARVRCPPAPTLIAAEIARDPFGRMTHKSVELIRDRFYYHASSSCSTR